MDRHWLLTWTTYGTWLPGDPRGFVGDTRDPNWNKILHNAPGTPYDEPNPLLYEFARSIMKGDPIYLRADQAPVLLEQFKETATHRHWILQATAVMANHIHLVVSVPGDPKPSTILKSFKAYGSRALNSKYPRPKSDTWWTESGSKRKLPNDQALCDGIDYVVKQEFPLLIWVASPGD